MHTRIWFGTVDLSLQQEEEKEDGSAPQIFQGSFFIWDCLGYALQKNGVLSFLSNKTFRW